MRFFLWLCIHARVYTYAPGFKRIGMRLPINSFFPKCVTVRIRVRVGHFRTHVYRCFRERNLVCEEVTVCKTLFFTGGQADAYHHFTLTLRCTRS